MQELFFEKFCDTLANLAKTSATTESAGKRKLAASVATSGLEMTQNAQKLNWTAEEVDAKLHQIMSSIHHACLEYGTEKDGYINYMSPIPH